MSKQKSIIDEVTDQESFKIYHRTITKNFDPVLFDDQYMTILVGKTISLKLDPKIKEEGKEIKIIKKKQNIFNTFDEEMVKTFEEYRELLVLSKKILLNYINYTNKLYIPYDNISFMEIKYLMNKYFFDEKLVVLAHKNYIKRHKNFKQDMKKLNNKTIIINNVKDLLQNIKETSTIICTNKISGIYKYYSNVEIFVEMYNHIIKLNKGNYILCIKVKTDYYIELIFDLIELLRYYFQVVILVNTKYDSRYNFNLLLNNKIQDYDENDRVEFSLDLYRLSSKELNNSYVEFMNKLYKKRIDKIKTFMAIESLKDTNPESYKLVLERINNYKHLKN